MNQIHEIANDLGQEIAKKKDIWFLETMQKYDLIKSNNLTNFDIYWLKEEMGVRMVEKDNTTQIYLGLTLVGEWSNNYQFVKIDNNEYKYVLKTNYWN
jgi:hypothetical protein